MNTRDLSEIKRRLNPDHRNPTVIQGFYFSSDGHIISQFTSPVGMLSQDECEKYMALFKKVLSGSFEQNLLMMDFTQDQIEHSDEYALLNKLYTSALKDDLALGVFSQHIVNWLLNEGGNATQSVEEMQAAGNRLVLLMYDGYDVPFRDGNGEIDRERSTDVFSYILCCVCPVKQSKATLTYDEAKGDFSSRAGAWTVGAPELGFMFPAYEERSTNVNRALYYTKDPGDVHEGFVEEIFNTEPQMTAREQKESFQAILQESLENECSMDVVQTVHETISGMIEEQKADKEAEPLTLGKAAVKKVLEESGVSGEKAEAFGERFDETFGEHAEIAAVNMVTPKEFKVNTPSVSIRVDPDHSDLVQTRMIDGKYYILVLADGEVEVNGMRITG